MKIKPIEESYINVSGQLYDSEFLNLVHIEDDSINLDNRVLFLNQSEKEKINAHQIQKIQDVVYICERAGTYGLVADLDIEAYQLGRVKSHELVLPDTIQGMLGNYQLYNTEVAPVLLVHEEKVNLQTIVQQIPCEWTFQVEDVTMFVYNGERAQQVLSYYDCIETLYIGDGHHRLYATDKSRFKKSVLAYFIDFDSIEIMPIHRLLHNVDDTMFQHAQQFIEDKLTIHEQAEVSKGIIKMMYKGKSYYIELMDVQDDLFWNQDVLRLNTQLFTTAFRNYAPSDIEFISEQERQAIVNELDERTVLFELAPVSKTEFIEFAQREYIMSPKSTWFYRKFPSFLIMKKYK